MLKKYGYVRIGAAVPKLKVGDPVFNTNQIIKQIEEANIKGVQIITFPELSITGYTAADLFFQDILLENALDNLKRLLNATKDMDIISIVGMPLIVDSSLFNTAVVINKGKILGVIPKTYIPNYNEFYEARWFRSSIEKISDEINILGNLVPFDTNIIFRDKTNNNIAFAIEICEDVWSVNPPSNRHVLNGATIIFNLSASNEIIGKVEYRKNLIKMQSAKNLCGYVYASAGVNESSTDLVFSGHSLIYENGVMLAENNRFDFDSNMIMADIDINLLINNRVRDTSFRSINPICQNYVKVAIDVKDTNNELMRDYAKYPFVPNNEIKRKMRCEEILNIQASGLAKRINHTGLAKTVIGISGGLDSTLAFLVIIKVYQKLGIDNSNIIAVTMPGFGTTDRTYDNAIKLVKNYGATLREINIKDACLQHFTDINHDPSIYDITYENAQARERTQILMDIANQVGGLLIGTGDLSELALGWCTYNGDHMSMYAVNASIPKTLVRYLVEYMIDIAPNNECRKTIKDILETPISPELLPPDEYGKIVQKTENTIGPYVLHDFFLYHRQRYGASPIKIAYIANNTFKDDFSKEEILKWLIIFMKRFTNQQFKRSCLPDGPKVGTISLSPRGDLRMPSDASEEIWVKKLKGF